MSTASTAMPLSVVLKRPGLLGERWCFFCGVPLEEMRRLGTVFCKARCRRKAWSFLRALAQKEIGFEALEALIRKAARAAGGGAFVGYTLTMERPDAMRPELHEHNTFPEKQRMTKRTPAASQARFKMSDRPYFQCAPFEEPRVPVPGPYVVTLIREDGSEVVVGPVHIGRAYASVRFYDVEGGSLLDSKGRRVANDLKRYKKSDSPLHAMSDEELEAELGSSREPATTEPSPAEPAVGANAQQIPIDPLAVFIDAIHIPDSQLDASGAPAHKVADQFQLSSKGLGFSLTGSVVKVQHPDPARPALRPGIVVRFKQATSNQVARLRVFLMKEKQKYEQQLLLRTTVAPGNPTTVPPGSPNATQTTLMEEVWKHVARADTSRPRPIPPITAPPKS